MKKKFLAFLIVAVMTFCSACFLTACDEKPSGDTEVTEEQWDAAFSLFWKNLTYEYDVGRGFVKIELLADGGIHQHYVEGGWGEFYGIYRSAEQLWQVYSFSDAQGEWVKKSDYTTAQAYINGAYGDGFGFSKSILPALIGQFTYFTFNSETKAYYAENMNIPMTQEESYPFDVTAKFDNGNLIYIFMQPSGHPDGETITGVFYDYGTTVINYPASVLNP